MIFRDFIVQLFLLTLCISIILVACSQTNTLSRTPSAAAATAVSQENTTLFRLLSPAQTGVNFSNTLSESDSLNILNEAYIYNGGGVGIGDFNNDGLVDVYFSANMVSNKLYLNKGSLQFEDITQAAGVAGKGRWCSGVSVADINADGWLDIYVSATFLKDSLQRRNLLYINQGISQKGIPSFKEVAAEYGLADTGYSTQGVFFDYDKDGDLDVYVLTNALNDKKTPIIYRPKVTDGSALNTDRLYRNDTPRDAHHSKMGQRGVFTNVSREAGILIEGWGHAVSISDVNLDGWPDIYVSNDFVANDILYINNGNGTFTNQAAEYFKHTSWYTMGTDIVDINNDGLVDVIALDMLPEDNLRKKGMLDGNEYFNYFNNRKFNYEHQYIRNVLQLNAGMTPDGHPVFSEVGYMAGMYQTDWSWTPLVADFDNDGFRDLIITNGLPRDVTDLDYIVYNNGQGYSGGTVNSSLSMTDSLPVVKAPDYAFKNTGGFLFADYTKNWGLHQPAFSNGSAYADLDNDGDLDLVVNNINENAFIYENTLNHSRQKNKSQYLSITFVGDDNNPRGIGATVKIYYAGGKQQFYEHQPCRGYLSTVDAKAHFGIGAVTNIDSLRVYWPDGKIQLLTTIKTNQTLTLSYQNAGPFNRSFLTTINASVFVSASSRYGIQFMHQEKDAIDYNIQPTLPHKLSQYGPGIAVGDVDKNGHDDFYIGGSPGNPGVFFMQDANGNFSMDAGRILGINAAEEDMGALFFDADNDKDLDLYVVSGSYEFPPNHPTSQDRLYLNNGNGQFEQSYIALPNEFTNGSCVRAADFDQDGDLDLFVGGRSVSGAYPSPPQSYILRNEGGRFVDVTAQYCPILQHLGMVTDALWSDFDGDKRVDLVLAGEWMPVNFFKNTGSSFISVTESTGIHAYTGWWNSLVSGDFDNDGDTDYVAGNLGLNSNFKASFEEPMAIYAKDLDENGKLDPMLFCYLKAEDGTRKPFPMHSRDDMISQMISIRRKYPGYKSFGRASVTELWRKQDQENALIMKATHLASSYIENKGNGKFAIKPLPVEAQTAPVFGMVSEDVDSDGNLDLLMVGNDYGIDPNSGRHDAFNGLYLKGDGIGNFIPMTIAQSGFFVKGDAKALATIHTAKGEDIWIATQNADSLMVYSKKTGMAEEKPRWLNLNTDDFYAELIYKNNKKRRVEFYYGSTYLSQSSRKIRLDKDVVKIMLTDFKGNTKEVIR